MKAKQEEGALDRRRFLKSLPRELFKGIQSFREAKNAKELSEAKVARIDITRCLPWGGASCQLCYLSCHLREKAIRMQDQKPIINTSACDGCAMCEVACKMVNEPPAIRMVVSSASLNIPVVKED